MRVQTTEEYLHRKGLLIDALGIALTLGNRE